MHGTRGSRETVAEPVPASPRLGARDAGQRHRLVYSPPPCSASASSFASRSIFCFIRCTTDFAMPISSADTVRLRVGTQTGGGETFASY